MKWLDTLVGNGFITLLIFIAISACFVIFFRKIGVIRKMKNNIPVFSVKIRGMLKRKEISQAIEACSAEKTPLSNIVRRGLKKYKFGRQRVIEELEAAGRQEVMRLESGLSFIAAVTGGAPMLGFLGTVLGLSTLLKTFKELQSSASISDFSSGIMQALISSAVGLAAGIIATMLHNYLVEKIGKTAVDLERFAMEILDMADERDKDATREE